jgi:glycosyl transferase family 1
VLIGRPRKIVVLGMIARAPVAGMVWLTLQYLVGLTRLGYEVYYAEVHGRNPSSFMSPDDHDGSAKAAAFIDAAMRWFGMPDGRWAFHARHSNGECYGMSASSLETLFQSADLVINLHGATNVGPDHPARGRLLFLETDPVEFAANLANGDRATQEFMDPHSWFFTWGENYGNADCLTPVTDRFQFRPTRQPVVMDLWEPCATSAGASFTTIASWLQLRPEVKLGSEAYGWSKHQQFMKVIELPRHTSQPFELMLAACPASDRAMLEGHGWTVRDATGMSWDLDEYRRYIGGSRGEFTIAKDQYARPRSGWFSDRTATYLAAGRPAITQETGFSNHLPTGEGLFAFSTLDEARDAVERVNADYERHRRAAADIAREHFSYDVVLPRMLSEAGL